MLLSNSKVAKDLLKALSLTLKTFNACKYIVSPPQISKLPCYFAPKNLTITLAANCGCAGSHYVHASKEMDTLFLLLGLYIY